jgi:hypothetical protein
MEPLALKDQRDRLTRELERVSEERDRLKKYVDQHLPT